ncbi:MAG: hypothetical protein JWO48_673 [Bryobacterales bacterium]|nr:hypothetical protein [Bryobacterales bacterium]
MKTGIVNGEQVEIQKLEQWPCDPEALADGLYDTNERKNGDLMDVAGDVMHHNVDQALLLRVDHGKELPYGCETAYFDKDGRRVLTCWTTTDEAQERINAASSCS